MTATQVPAEEKISLWTPQYRSVSLGMVLLTVVIAFEYLGIATALPSLARDLHAGSLYSWPLLAYTAANVVGVVLSGNLVDRLGVRRPMLGGLALFAAGLVITGLAHSMAVVLLGRIVQSIGSGAAMVANNVIAGIKFPLSYRSAVSALIATTWMLPGLIGPVVAGFITQTIGWRWVFLAILPFVAIAAFLMARSLDDEKPTDSVKRKGMLLPAFLASVGIFALSWTGQHPNGIWLLTGAAGLALLMLAGRKIVPSGMFRLRRGLPSVLLAKAMTMGPFNAVEVYIPLILVTAHGLSPTFSGLPLTVSAIMWGLGARWQGRRPKASRAVLLRRFTIWMAVATGTMALATLPGPTVVFAYVAWAIGGAAAGISLASISLLILTTSNKSEYGFASSAGQLVENTSTSLMFGVGSALMAAFGTTRPVLGAFCVAMTGLILLGRFGPARRVEL